MKYILQIKRQKEGQTKGYWQTIEYACENAEKETIATVLRAVDYGRVDRDIDGNLIEPIGWECSCMQKKCGSCAMIIDGKPGLACDFFLDKHAGKRPITVEPLKKFPVVRDLIVDRSVMRENLKKLQVWMAEEAIVPDEKHREIMYDASRCLQCGCCLEVCPNFCSGGSFFGAAGALPISRIINATERNGRTNIKKNYKEYIDKGCGKALSCQNVCPAKIKMDRTLSSINAFTNWS
jgi:succinate dehydrogenase / fumarate reductase iron-sulfur subunit